MLLSISVILILFASRRIREGRDFEVVLKLSTGEDYLQFKIWCISITPA